MRQSRQRRTNVCVYIADNKAQAFSPGIDIAVHCCIDLCAPYSYSPCLRVCASVPVWARAQKSYRTKTEAPVPTKKKESCIAHLAVVYVARLCNLYLHSRCPSLISADTDGTFLWFCTQARTHTQARTPSAIHAALY